MLGLRFKEVFISPGMYLVYVKEMLNSWATQGKIILRDWEDLATAILEVHPQLLW